MQIEKLKTEQLIPADYNPRKDLKPGDSEYDKLKRSIEQFGYVEPVIWNKTTGKVVGGHQRLKVLLDMGISEVECVVIEMDEEKEKALNIALNKISGEWDKDKLVLLLADLQGADFDVSLTGFDPAEIEDLFNATNKNDVKEDDFDVEKALDAEPFVQLGDLWLLGRHRLLCGDATNSENVTLLMDGKKANLCVTDPPYNCAYQGGTGMKIINDSMDGEAFYAFLLSALKNAYDSLADGGAVYIFHSDAEKVNFFNATVDAGFHYSTTCIWVKNSLVLGRMDYQMRHEPVIYAFKDTAKHRWYSDRKQTTVWEFDRPSKSKLHPTMKSLPLIAYPVKNSSAPNSIVLDSFGGSGSTLLVCEQTDRVCYTMELDPKYASAIVRRFAAYCGNTDTISVIRNGKELECKEVYIPTENDLAIKDATVDDPQKGSNADE